MKNALKKLRQQQELIGLSIQVIEWNNIARGENFEITSETVNSQFEFVKEEKNEFELAKSSNDVIEQYDAIADIFVTEYYLNCLFQIEAYGVAYDIDRLTDNYLRSLVKEYKDFNLDCIIDCIKEVMRSNWTKFANYELTSNEFNVVKRGGLWLLLDKNGKVRKPECYEEPNLKPILEKHGVI